ncbi:MAG: SGNH/GDSL hydrolase family protein [Planctomycetota bacterium]
MYTPRLRPSSFHVLNTRTTALTVSGAIIAALAIVLSGGRETEAAQIVVMGDSWAKRIGPALTTVAREDGFSVANAGMGLTAAEMATHPNYIEQTLAANPDAQVVHLSIGGNDILDFTPAISERSVAQRNQLLSTVTANVQTIVDRIAAVRPSVEVYHVSYDFLPSLPGQGTPSEVNAAFLEQASALESGIVSDRYTYLNNYGFGQLAMGIPALSLAPGDPSLPKLDQPGPAALFGDPIHLNDVGYSTYAELTFGQYRSSLRVPEPSGPFLSAIAIGLGGLSRRGR